MASNYNNEDVQELLAMQGLTYLYGDHTHTHVHCTQALLCQPFSDLVEE